MESFILEGVISNMWIGILSSFLMLIHSSCSGGDCYPVKKSVNRYSWMPHSAEQEPRGDWLWSHFVMPFCLFSCSYFLFVTSLSLLCSSVYLFCLFICFTCFICLFINYYYNYCNHHHHYLTRHRWWYSSCHLFFHFVQWIIILSWNDSLERF